MYTCIRFYGRLCLAMMHAQKGGVRLGDPAIRIALVDHLKEISKTRLVLHEVPLRGSRTIADVLVVDKYLSAYEIKSEKDNLSRFDRQQVQYERTCDFMTLVGTRVDYLTVIPSHWGFLMASFADGRVIFDVVRKASRNHAASANETLFMLRGSELRTLLRTNGFARLSSLSKESLVNSVVANFGECQARAAAITILLTRRSWTCRQLGLQSEAERLRFAFGQPRPLLDLISPRLL